MKNILITGSNGFIGTNLYKSFLNKIGLTGLDISKNSQFPEFQVYNWEQFQILPPVNTIIHLAGKAHDTKNTANAQSYFDINLGLTQKIFDYFLQSDAEKFIFFSSVKAVADTVHGILTEENSPTSMTPGMQKRSELHDVGGITPERNDSGPQTPYGQSKLAAEQYITDAYAKWIDNNKQQTANKEQQTKNNKQKTKNIYILRPAMIHGPGNKGNLNLLYAVVQKGIPWPLGAYDNKRSMVSIENLIFVIQQFITKDIPSGTYQLADDEPVSTNEIIALMANSLSRKPKIWHISKALVQAAAKAGSVLHLPLNSERLKKLTESYVVSNEKIKKALGISKLPVDAKEGLLKTFSSFREK